VKGEGEDNNYMFKLITSLLFPIKCAVCGKLLAADDKYRLCPACFEGIRPAGSFQCKGCGRILPDTDKYCFDCLKQRPRILIRSYTKFNDAIRPLIHKFKYGRQPHLSRILSKFLQIALQSNECFSNCDLIIPVPCHWTRRFSRGYDHVQILAREFSHVSGIAMDARILVKTKKTPPQAKLSRERRLSNLNDAFAVRNAASVKGKSIILVDDVCTTGATLFACAKTLLDCGADSVVGLAAARD
jgi:ComF family protein